MKENVKEWVQSVVGIFWIPQVYNGLYFQCMAVFVFVFAEAEALEWVESVREWFGFDSEMVLPGGEPVVGQRCWSRDRNVCVICTKCAVCSANNTMCVRSAHNNTPIRYSLQKPSWHTLHWWWLPTLVGTAGGWLTVYCVFAYLCICVFVFLCICVFVYLCTMSL